jgi:hypothetical protein
MVSLEVGPAGLHVRIVVEKTASSIDFVIVTTQRHRTEEIIALDLELTHNFVTITLVVQVGSLLKA